jgi:hypothetical protein
VCAVIRSNSRVLRPYLNVLTSVHLHQASVNVGGAVLNVVTIEHLILRHSPEGRQVRIE